MCKVSSEDFSVYFLISTSDQTSEVGVIQLILGKINRDSESINSQGPYNI